MIDGRLAATETSDGAERAFPEVAPTSEAEWLAWSATRPAVIVDAPRVVVLSPHPDDETLACGGLIADRCRAGQHVRVVAVTDGEASHPAVHRLRTVRRSEQRRALARLGVEIPVIRLGLPDGAVTARIADLVEQLEPLVRDTDVLIAPWASDGHSDHDACGVAAATVAARAGCRLLAYPVWAWQWATPAMLGASTPWATRTMSTQALAAKIAAITEFRSQTSGRFGAVIVDEQALVRFRRPFEVFADVG